MVTVLHYYNEFKPLLYDEHGTLQTITSDNGLNSIMPMRRNNIKSFHIMKIVLLKY